MLRYLLSTPRSTPIPALNRDLRVWPIEYRIKAKKLTFAYHVLGLSNTSLAYEIFKAQSRFCLPGLCEDVKDLIQKLKLPNIFECSIYKHISKGVWKKMVKEALTKEIENDLLTSTVKLKKLKMVQ